MSVTQYIGARYVPMLADPFTWSNTRAYEPLTIVSYQGNSYTSRQYVPIGVDITNEDFWASTGNYNAQIEAYRQEVQAFDGRIDTLEDKFDANGKIASGLVISSSIADGSVTTGKIANSNVTTAKIADSNVTTAKIADSNVTTAKIADSAITSAKITDSNVTTAKIADSNVTTAKIADSAITSAKIANGTITNDDIANGTIKKSKLANDDILLIFGDSWANFVDHPNWATSVNNVLGCGVVKNFGVGGAGFTVSGNLISTQVSNALSQMTAAEKANTKYIVVIAGINDYSPYPASNMASNFDSVFTTIKNNFPNALIEWMPTTCTPSYGNSTAPKWLYSIAGFWYLTGRYFAGSENADEPNRFCAPACGPMFYFNHTANISAWFTSDGLHLNTLGKNAIVNAILSGFGKGNMVYSATKEIARGSSYVTMSATPTHLDVKGAFSNTGNTDLGAFGQRVLGVMAAEQAERLFVNKRNPQQYTIVAIAGSLDVSYLNVEAISSYTGAQLSPAGSYSTGTYYLS